VGRLSKKKTSNHTCISQPRLTSQVFMKWWKILSELWRIFWRPEREDKREDETQKATATFLATFILRFYIPLFEKRYFFFKKRGLYFRKENIAMKNSRLQSRVFCIRRGAEMLTSLFMNLWDTKKDSYRKVKQTEGMSHTKAVPLGSFSQFSEK
jgi:hypothetical protein